MAKDFAPISRKERKFKTEIAQNVLQRQYSSLIEILSVEDILPKLFSNGIISAYEKQTIESQPTPYKKAGTLLDSLHKKSFHEFEMFCDIIGASHVKYLQGISKDLLDDYHQGLGRSVTLELPIKKEGKRFSKEEGRKVILNMLCMYIVLGVHVRICLSH